MNSFEHLFERIASETRVTDANTVEHSRFGLFESGNGKPAHGSAAAGPPADLWQIIYLHYHAGDDDGVRSLRTRRRVVAPLFDREDPAFVAMLEDANRGAGFFESGWKVSSVDGEHMLVRRDGLTLLVAPADVHASSRRVGAAAAVRFPKGLRYAQAGCYIAVADAGLCLRDAGPVIRLYLAVGEPEGAASLLRELTALLNARGTPFQIKVMNHPTELRRRDCFIVYLHAAAWETLRDELDRVRRHCRRWLHDDAPCFNLPLGPGLSFAEEPVGVDGTVSFGQHRSQLVAQGLFTAFQNSDRSAEARHAWILRSYRDAGLDVSRPYLNPRATA